MSDVRAATSSWADWSWTFGTIPSAIFFRRSHSCALAFAASFAASRADLGTIVSKIVRSLFTSSTDCVRLSLLFSKSAFGTLVWRVLCNLPTSAFVWINSYLVFSTVFLWTISCNISQRFSKSFLHFEVSLTNSDFNIRTSWLEWSIRIWAAKLLKADFRFSISSRALFALSWLLSRCALGTMVVRRFFKRSFSIVKLLASSSFWAIKDLGTIFSTIFKILSIWALQSA